MREVTMRLGPVPDVATSYRHSLGEKPTRVTFTQTVDGTEAPVYLVSVDRENLNVKAQTNCSGVVALATLGFQPGSSFIVAEQL
jgi:hypothetical protein